MLKVAVFGSLRFSNHRELHGAIFLDSPLPHFHKIYSCLETPSSEMDFILSLSLP